MANVIADVAAATESVAEGAPGGGPGGSKVGIVGYCWGGQIVYLAACRLGDRLSCASGYYGGGIVPFLGETPAVPLMLHFGTEDASIPLSDAEQIGKAHPEVAIHIYPGGRHAFFNPEQASYDADAAALAWRRSIAFLDERFAAR